MSKEEIKKLQDTIFTILNYANIYVLMLDEKMEIQFINNSLAIDLGFNEYSEIVGRCWLDFIKDEDRSTITLIHDFISRGREEWRKYQEFQNYIKGKNSEIYVNWFNSHVNSTYNWVFSFGVRKDNPIIKSRSSISSIRKYWQDVIEKDRTMIETMKDRIIFRNKIIDF